MLKLIFEGLSNIDINSDNGNEANIQVSMEDFIKIAENCTPRNIRV